MVDKLSGIGAICDPVPERNTAISKALSNFATATIAPTHTSETEVNHRPCRPVMDGLHSVNSVNTCKYSFFKSPLYGGLVLYCLVRNALL